MRLWMAVGAAYFAGNDDDVDDDGELALKMKEERGEGGSENAELALARV